MIDILRYSTEQTVHIILSTLKSLHKLESSLIKYSAENISEPILLLYHNLHNDYGASRILIDLMLQMLEDPSGGEVFLSVFVPNAVQYLQQTSEFMLTEHPDIPFSEEESH